MSKRTKLLIETSCVPVAMSESSKLHIAHFREAIGDGEFWSSIYIRKEYIRRWIRDYIQCAFLIDHYGSVTEALRYIKEDFKIRTVKGALHSIIELLQEKGDITNQKSAGKGIARMAVRKLKEFDRLFGRKINNACRCQTGGKKLTVNYNKCFESLRTFVEAIDDFPDCPVNDFLDFADPRGASQALLKNVDVLKTTAGEKLSELVAARSTINCSRCSTIADAIIAMEQPRGWRLVHIDKAFVTLCMARSRERIPIKSLRRVHREAAEAESSSDDAAGRDGP